MSNDLEVVLEAARLLADSGVHFVFVGDGKEKPALTNRAREMNLQNVSFLPSVPKSEMAETLAAADACIAILKPLEEYKLTYPNKVFDYMAAGRPIALAIDGVIREVVESAGCGIFAQPGDSSALAQAISQLAQNPSAAKEMGRKGRIYLQEHFSREKTAEQLFNLLEEMTHG